MISGNALGLSLTHQTHHQSQDTPAIAATVGQVADEDQATSGRVSAIPIAKPGQQRLQCI